MNPHLTHRLIVGFLVFLALASISRAKVSKDKVQHVLTKLEDYALEKDPEVQLAIGDLEAAYAEFETWDDAFRWQVVNHTPLMQLLIDFLFHPMDRFYDLIGDSPEEHVAYINRLAVNYKRFRPSYLGQLVGFRVHPNPKTTHLIESLFGINNPKPLTLKMIQEAKIEYDAFIAKVREIPEFEDIYSNLEDLILYRNYYVQPEIQALGTFVFPALGHIKDDQLPALKDYYVDELKKQNIMVHKGKITRFVRA